MPAKKNATPKAQDWHDVVDAYVGGAEEAGSLSVAEMFEYLEGKLDGTIVVESASAIEEYFERKVATDRGLNLNLHPAVEGAQDADQKQTWHTAVDSYIASADDTTALSTKGLHAHLKDAIGEPALVQSAGAIHGYYHRAVGRRTLATVGSPSKSGKAAAPGTPSKAAGSGSAAASPSKASAAGSPSKAKAAAAGTPNRGGSAVAAAAGDDDAAGALVAEGDRKDWHDAVDAYVGGSDDVATLTSSAMFEAVGAAVGEATAVESASAIEDYFERKVASVRGMPVPMAPEGDGDGEGEGEVGQKRSRSQSVENPRAAKAAKTA